MASPCLEQRKLGLSFGEAVRNQDQDQPDYALEQADRSGQAELELQDALTIDPRVDDVANAVNRDRVEDEDLIEACLEDVAEAQKRHQNDDRQDARQRD